MTDSGLKTRNLLGLEIAVTQREAAINVITQRFNSSQQTLVVFANTNLLALLRNDILLTEVSSKCIVLNDGLGINIVSLLSGRPSFTENLNGTDFTLDLLKSIGKQSRIFCFGSKENVVKTAGWELARSHSLSVVGYTSGFVVNSYMNGELIDAINSSRSDVVLVGLGNTRQEEWMLAHADRLEAKLIVCVGAFFDFTAGAVYRAPLLVRRVRLEWLFRLCQEPSRLWRRYSVDPIILAIIVLYKRFTSA